MKKVARSLLNPALLSLALVAVLAGALSAEDEAKKAKKDAAKKGAKRPAAAARFVQFPKGIEPTAEQKEALAKIAEECGPKLQAVLQKQRDVISQEKLKARQEALKKLRAEGAKKGKELQAAADEAAGITAAEQEQLKSVRAEVQGLRKEVNEKILALLTPEQKAQLPKRGGKGAKADGEKKAKPAGEKKAKAEKKAKDAA